MENFIGEIRMFAGSFAPQGWSFCDGSLLSIADNDVLYTLLGTPYGGDAHTPFGLPDLRGRLPIGQGNGSGLSPRTLGQNAGEEGHTLTVQEMAAHAHPVSASTAPASTITPGPGVMYAAVTPDNQNGVLGLYTNVAPPDVPVVQLAGQAVANAGGGQAHDNTMSTLTINYIIALQGIYPTQN